MGWLLFIVLLISLSIICCLKFDLNNARKDAEFWKMLHYKSRDAFEEYIKLQEKGDPKEDVWNVSFHDGTLTDGDKTIISQLGGHSVKVGPLYFNPTYEELYNDRKCAFVENLKKGGEE